MEKAATSVVYFLYSGVQLYIKQLSALGILRYGICDVIHAGLIPEHPRVITSTMRKFPKTVKHFSNREACFIADQLD